jgi:hypothetical protein
MSKIIKYNVDIKPSPANITIQAGINNSEVTATVDSIPSISFKLHATGNFCQKIISTVIEPLAGLIAKKLEDTPSHLMKGKSCNVYKIGDINLKSITVTPSNLEMSNHNGYMMIGGSVDQG